MDSQRRTLEECESLLLNGGTGLSPFVSDVYHCIGLDDLCVRFIVNLPESELSGFDRIGTHVEEAHWFYEDFIRPLDPSLPPMSLRTFSLRLFQHCPLTAHCDPDVLEKAYAHWIGYKKRIPVRGAILLNEAMDSVLLVRGWHKSSAWMFPRGKINQGEDDLDCAVREVYEETGFNAMEAGLIPEDRALRHFEMSIKDQHVKLFVIPNVPMDTRFEPRTRKEIGKIQWYKLAELPGRRKKQGQDAVASPNANKFFMIASFLEPLNRWIKQQLKRKDRIRNVQRNGHLSQAEFDDGMTEEEGMITEAAPEPSPVFATAESHEAATRELHRLLKIQPPTQRSQAGTFTAEQDKGKALLAMLQRNNDAPLPERSNIDASVDLPNTPLDHMRGGNTQQRTHNYHHPTQRLDPNNAQAPPPFSVQQDMNTQLLSVLGVSVNQPQHPVQSQFGDSRQHLAMMMQSAPAHHPVLAHPQPLSRQASHILAGPPAAAPTTSGDRTAQVQQQANMSGSMNLPQQLVANLRQPPAVLDGNRLALLNAFKKDAAPQEDFVANDPSNEVPTSGPTATTLQQPTMLGSPYGGTRPVLVTQQAPPNTMGTNLANSQLPMPQSALKPSSVSPLQQKALLDIFKKQTSAPAPSYAESATNFKENGSSFHPAQGIASPQAFAGSHTRSSALPVSRQTSYSSAQSAQFPNTTHAAQTLAMHPKHGDRLTPQQQQPVSPYVADGNGAPRGVNIVRSPERSTQSPNLSGSPYSKLAQFGTLTPPTNMTSYSNLTPRRQESDPQQVQKLMSLFSKSATAVTGSPLASPGVALKGKEPTLYSAGRVPTPGSRVGLMGASPGLDGTSGSATMSRRSSQQQAPISPENEKFLLNYLKSVSGGTK